MASLEQYARFDLRLRFGAEVRSARREAGVWHVETAAGVFAAPNLIAATGFRPDPRPLLRDVNGALDAAGMPSASGRPTAAPGLFFCGFYVSPTGMLREIGIEARRIAAHIARGV